MFKGPAIIYLIILLLSSGSGFANGISADHRFNVFVFTKTNGFRHQSIPHSIDRFKEWSIEQNWRVIYSEDSTLINDEVLEDLDVLVFLNTSGNILGDAQQESLVKYINAGGGFVGIHVASNTEVEWSWFHNLVGAQFKDHPAVQSAKMLVNHSFSHPAVKHLSDTFEVIDEWYNFKEPVLPHVNVLLTLDEQSYEGKKMNHNHPIAWYHYYEGGRSFYTGLGHTSEIYNNEDFKKHLVNAINWAGKRVDIPTPGKWDQLLDQGLKKWDTFIGIPRPSGAWEDKATRNQSDQKKTSGLNNDLSHVYSIIEENGKPMLYVSGEIYGGISTKQEYSNYHFKARFKWGEKKWGPTGKNRDSGILYHCVGPQGAYANAWMSSLQSQIQETHFGDFIAMKDVTAQARVVDIHEVKGEIRGTYNPRAELVDVGRALKNEDREKPTGKWNTLEVLCLGTSSIHVINGKVVSAIENTKSTLKAIAQPLKSGKIQLQSEGAEAYYKDIKIRAITAIPRRFRRQMK